MSENLPAPKSTVLSRGDSEAIEAFKLTSMADAMNLARQRVREVDDDDPDPYGYAQELENEFDWDILPKKWKANPDDPQWIKRMKARARRAAVANFYVTGHKISDIAKKCKVSEVTVYRDMQVMMQDWRKSYLEDIETLAAKDLATMDFMLQRLHNGIMRGDPKSISVALSILQERANILGTRQGVQVDIEEYVREVASANGYDPDTAVAHARKISITMK